MGADLAMKSGVMPVFVRATSAAPRRTRASAAAGLGARWSGV